MLPSDTCGGRSHVAAMSSRLGAGGMTTCRTVAAMASELDAVSFPKDAWAAGREGRREREDAAVLGRRVFFF